MKTSEIDGQKKSIQPSESDSTESDVDSLILISDHFRLRRKSQIGIALFSAFLLSTFSLPYYGFFFPLYFLLGLSPLILSVARVTPILLLRDPIFLSADASGLSGRLLSCRFFFFYPVSIEIPWANLDRFEFIDFDYDRSHYSPFERPPSHRTGVIRVHTRSNGAFSIRDDICTESSIDIFEKLTRSASTFGPPERMEEWKAAFEDVRYPPDAPYARCIK